MKDWDISNDDKRDKISCKLYTCTSCGAELIINDVEASTFCAYCGQPTIVFDRVSQGLKPTSIIPFKITKEEALKIFRKHINKARFVPKEVKNIKDENMRGIYVPFYLISLFYQDKQLWKGEVGGGKSTTTKYFRRDAGCKFNNITCDASAKLTDAISQRLEPFDLSELRPFDVNYLSGFYADKKDKYKEDMVEVAVDRAKKLYNMEVQSGISASRLQIVESSPYSRIENVEYTMLPVWFTTFRYEDEVYSILINGQTGKVVGAIPYEMKKIKMWFAILASIVCVVLTVIFLFMMKQNGIQDWMKVTMWIGILSAPFICSHSFKKIKYEMNVMKEQNIVKFIKERQER